MIKKALWLVVVILTLCEISAYKYLVVSPIPSKSHSILGDALVEYLADAGHEVTYITAFTPEKVSPRVTIIDTSDHIRNFPIDATFNLKSFMDGTVTTNNFMTFAPLMLEISRATLGNSNVRKLLADENQRFDAVIAEWMYNEVYVGFAGVFNCPLIWFSSIEPHWMVMQLIDEIPNPAYSTDMLTADSIPPLTFRQRVVELYTQIVGRLAQTFWLSGLERDVYNEYFVPFIRDRYNTVPPFEELRYNASLMLCNSHLSMNTPIRLPANVITIGGYHIKPNIKPLPEDLQTLMDNSKDGVIYFSMGSNLRSKHFPDEVKQSLLKMFGKLKQIVLWKFEEDLPNRPNNVHIVQWAPQQSILAHKNCILFITHGGLLSTTETVHFGVPIIGIPVFADQFVNVGRAVKKGFAQRVDLSYSLAADIEKAIRNVLDNPSYTTRVKELSAIYHDRTVPPATELVHWAEQVVKTKGARHLRSPAFMMPWYQKMYLDLILVLLVVLLIFYKIIIFFIISVTKRVNFILYLHFPCNVYEYGSIIFS
ncbi:UDP-glucosyltransferase 2-like [Bicyclus anynana]|uniref:UDP-glucosyltransferase 2-like n=1 Tax=Bicyclus anynana TaxID=110368 RepID=A0A6J1NDG0_BICAN|nr:UDP-glucosyltransferase 2-like [Bicyclus anynana]